MVNGNKKGKRGELEFAALLREFGYEARRSQQYAGLGGDEDLAHDVPGLHIEVKRREALSLPQSLKQATRDAKAGTIPVIAHRPNRAGWMITMDAREFFMMLRAGQELDEF